MYIGPYLIIALFVAIILVPLFSRSKFKHKLEDQIIDVFERVPTYRDYELSSIKSYQEYVEMFTDTSKHIDDITWNDLDMDQVFKRINACNTSIGEEYLYNVLHVVDFKGRELEYREKLIKYFDEHPGERVDTQIYLSKLGKSSFNQLCACIYDSESKLLDNSWIYNILAVLPIIFGLVAILNPTIGIPLTILSILANALIYYRAKFKLEKEVAVIRYFSAMLWSCDKILKVNDENNLSLFNKLKESYIVFRSLKGKLSRSTQRSAASLDFLAEYVNMIFLSEIRSHNRVMDKINEEAEAFHSLYKAFGEIDMAISTLSFRGSLDEYCRPEFIDTHLIEFKELYHPLIDEPITNSDSIIRNSIVTGPNASGKSTFIKALAINSILAQTINTCMACEYKIKHSLIMTSMAVRDDILEGDSYFITEIKSLKRVLDKINEVPCTCFIDEILRGTNTIERIAASSSILKYLSDKDCLCMVASHDIELTKIMEKICDNYHFSEKVDSDGVSFDFKLKHGYATTKNAIRLLEYMDYDNSIVKDANESVEDFIKNGAWEIAGD